MFNDIYKNRKILITGHTGFKGSWLTSWLLDLGAKVYGLSNDIPTNPSMFECLGLSEQIEDYRADIRDRDEVKKIVSKIKPDFIFHLAAQPIVSLSYKNPAETIETNVIGVTNILEAIRKLENDCVGVIITSDKCYHNNEWEWGYRESDRLGGKDIYSGSKGAAEIIFQSYYHSFFSEKKNKIRIATTRAGNVIGGGDWALDRIVPDCMRSWSSGTNVEIRSPNAIRPWEHVLEPLSGYLSLGAKLYNDSKISGESFNFGPTSGETKTVEDLLKDLREVWPSKDLGTGYVVVENKPFNEATLLKLNCDKSYVYLRWLPTLSYHDTVKFTGDWYRCFYIDKENMFEKTVKQIKAYSDIAESRGIHWAIN